MKQNKLFKMVLAAMLLALALVLPLVTGQMQQIGNALLPMHFPVLLCGFFCGPVFGAIIGGIAPLLRFMIWGMPVLIPKGIGMCFELATYGLISGLMYKLLPGKKSSIYISLIAAMLCGRVIWGIARCIMYGLGKADFGFAAFIAGGFTNAIPGIALQIILIPVIVMAVNKAFPNLNKKLT